MAQRAAATSPTGGKTSARPTSRLRTSCSTLGAQRFPRPKVSQLAREYKRQVRKSGFPFRGSSLPRSSNQRNGGESRCPRPAVAVSSPTPTRRRGRYPQRDAGWPVTDRAKAPGPRRDPAPKSPPSDNTNSTAESEQFDFDRHGRPGRPPASGRRCSAGEFRLAVRLLRRCDPMAH